MSVHYHSFITIVTLITILSPSFNEETGDGSGDGFDSDLLVPTTNIQAFEINCTNNCNSISYTLSEIATNYSNSSNSSISVYINVENIQLAQRANFHNLMSVFIYGNDNTLVCDIGMGIVFLSVETVSIQNLTMKTCGSLWSPKPQQFLSALHMLQCGQIMVLNITVTQSNGSGLNINRPKYNVTITDSYFINNKLIQNDGPTLTGGNGLRLNISNNNGGGEAQFVNIERCLFAQNMGTGREYSFLYGNLLGRGRGGGMFVKIDNSFRIAVLNISHCRFEENTAYLGAGLSVSLRGNGSTKNTVEISQTVFTRNGCRDSSILGIGGGTLIAFENRNNYDQNINKVHLRNIRFETNCAALGGGTFFFSNKYVSKTTGYVVFDNCTWTKNKAHIGSAMLLTPNVFVRAIVGHLPVPHFKNCTFQENSIDICPHSDKKSGSCTIKQFGSGTIYSSLFSIKFIENVRFIHNFGSGITIISGEANLYNSSAEFLNNTAVQGGALSLIGASAMIIGFEKTYTFENNRAYDRGGAIFVQLVDSAEITTSRSCFIHYQDQSKRPIHSRHWNSSLIFRNNMAKSAGHSIFATSLLPCQVVSSNEDEKDYEVLNISNIFQKPGIMIESNSTEKQISTEGTEFIDIHQPLAISPGLQRELDINILDDLGQPVDMNIAAILPTNSNLRVTSIFSNGSQYKVKLNGLEGDNDILTLQTLGTIQLRYILNVTLQKCPPGYRLDNHDHHCQCDFESYIGITKCENNVAYLMEGFWAGYFTTDDNRNILATSICPVGFCQYRNSDVSIREVRLPNRTEELEKAICGDSRKGILCGTCNEGYTAYYHSPQLRCYKEKPLSCKLGWLFYILSEIVPVTIVFGLVLAFNINLTSGGLNGFILFSQLQRTLYFDASGIIPFGPITQQLTQVYQMIYGFFNLDFFNIESLSYCLWKNASVLDMICFKYVTIVYSFLLVISVILFMKYCAARCLGRYYSISALRNSIIHGISGFLVLCYTQTITVSFNILYSYRLAVSKDEKISLSNLTRVWFSGDYENFGKGHLPYAVPALVVVLTVGCIPPIILLCYPQLNKVLTYLKLNKAWGLRNLEYLNKLKPLFDSFQGSFKDKYRFFAGLYFFYRWTGLLAYTYWSSFSGFYMTVQVIVLLMLVLHSICQPYQKWQHNVLDTFIFAIILITIGFSNLNYYLVRVDSGRNNDTTLTSVFQLFFIYLPIFYVLLHVITWVLRSKYKAEQSHPEEFVLTKIRKKINSFSLSGSEEVRENDLPYRLLGHREDQSFTETETVLDKVDLDTY